MKVDKSDRAFIGKGISWNRGFKPPELQVRYPFSGDSLNVTDDLGILVAEAMPPTLLSLELDLNRNALVLQDTEITDVYTIAIVSDQDFSLTYDIFNINDWNA
jgi:hypothetical protein